MVKLKIPVSDQCPECEGQAYLPAGQAISSSGEPYTKYAPCPVCEGSGRKTRWIELEEFARLLQQAACQHVHVARTGGFHFSAGDCYDDITEYCSDCGLDLDQAN